MDLVPVNFLEGVSGPLPDRESRLRRDRLGIRKNLTGQQNRVLGRFGYEYFESALGYGGYRYDGRYGQVADRMIEYYGLGPESRLLDVGCAKGYLVHEFQSRLGRNGAPNAVGCDISSYALKHGRQEVRSQLFKMSAHQLGFPDSAFDLVVSVDTIHNLPEDLADKGIREMMRVSRADCFVQVASYSTPAEEEALRVWGATVKTFRSSREWLECFGRLGYTGELWLKLFRFGGDE